MILGADTVLLLVIPNAASIYYFARVASESIPVGNGALPSGHRIPALGKGPIGQGNRPAFSANCSGRHRSLLISSPARTWWLLVQAKVDFKNLYGNPAIDRWRRLKQDATNARKRCSTIWKTWSPVKTDAKAAVS